jgi:hypothetical protein
MNSIQLKCNRCSITDTDKFTLNKRTKKYFMCCTSCRLNKKKLGVTKNNSKKCPCGLRLSTCRICNNPIEVYIKIWRVCHRQGDKHKGIYDTDHFISTEYLTDLCNNQKRCIYCHSDNDFITRDRRKKISIERIDNKIGHINSNCVLACGACNCKRSDRYTFDEFMKQTKHLRHLRQLIADIM